MGQGVIAAAELDERSGVALLGEARQVLVRGAGDLVGAQDLHGLLDDLDLLGAEDLVVLELLGLRLALGVGVAELLLVLGLVDRMGGCGRDPLGMLHVVVSISLAVMARHVHDVNCGVFDHMIFVDVSSVSRRREEANVVLSAQRV